MSDHYPIQKLTEGLILLLGDRPLKERTKLAKEYFEKLKHSKELPNDSLFIKCFDKAKEKFLKSVDDMSNDELVESLVTYIDLYSVTMKEDDYE